LDAARSPSFLIVTEQYSLSAVTEFSLHCSGIIPYLISLEEAADSAEARVDFEPRENCISCVHRSVHNSEVLWYFQWHCQQASHTVHSTLCTVHGTMHSALYTMHSALCTMHGAPCTVHCDHALWTMHCALNACTCSRQTSHTTSVALPPEHNWLCDLFDITLYQVINETMCNCEHKFCISHHNSHTYVMPVTKQYNLVPANGGNGNWHYFYHASTVVSGSSTNGLKSSEKEISTSPTFLTIFTSTSEGTETALQVTPLRRTLASAP